MSDVGNACDAGTGCGGCRPEIASILESEQAPLRGRSVFSPRLPVLQETG